MAGTIIADFIRTDASQLSLNVGNTTFATINASGFFSNTGTQLIAANGKISGASVISGSITSAAIATAANTIPRSSMTTGAVLQVVSTTKTDTFSMTGGFTDITGLSATITPTSATSKIFVIVNLATSSSSTSGLNTFNLVRNSTNISQPATSPSFAGTICAYLDLGDNILPVGFNFLDSPATTSATTYKVQMKSNTGTQYINRRSSADSAFTSTITVMEIAG